MKTRFSPSPTGHMHLGNVRTALFNVLLARHSHGEFLLRIEDTDPVRSKTEFAELLLTDLNWLNLNSSAKPVYQSERKEWYDKYYEILSAQQKAYPCFCTEEQLALSRKIQLSQGKPPRYAGTCRNLNPDDIKMKLSQGHKPALRFNVSQGHDIQFDDLVKGLQKFNTNDIGDFIIRRGDGSASFFFCNAIDDALMGVTHALRGEDHLTNTPRQILILQTLNLPVPHYGHIALIIGHDGSPLSKRHGSKSLKELREIGFLPAAVNNYLSRLGHSYESNQLMSLDELAEKFALKHVGTTPAHYDESHLLHWQKLAVMNLTDEGIINWLDFQENSQMNNSGFINFVRANFLFPHEACEWADILFKPELIVDNNYREIIEIVKQYVLNNPVNYKAIINTIQEKLSIKGKALFMPLRLILTGKDHGPDLQSIIELMGQHNILKRLGA